MPPKLAQETRTMTMTSRPNLDELVKAAMEGTANKYNLFAEAQRHFDGAPVEEKTASAQTSDTVEFIPAEYTEKLAGALDFVAASMRKQAGEGPGTGPNTLPISMSGSPKNEVIKGDSGAVLPAAPKASVAKNPHVAHDPATGLATDEAHPAGGGQHYNQGGPGHVGPVNKTAAAMHNLAILNKVAAEFDPSGAGMPGGFQGAGRDAGYYTNKPGFINNTLEDINNYAMPIGGGAVGAALGGGLTAGAGALGGIKDPRILAALGVGGAAVGGTVGGVGTHALRNLMTGYTEGRAHGQIEGAKRRAEMLAASQPGAAGGGGGMPDEASMLPKAASANLALSNLSILNKIAGEEAAKAHMSGGGTHGPNTPPDGVSATGQNPVPLPAAAAAQAAVMDNSQRVTDVTRRETKKQPKAEVGRVVDAPVLSASHDKVLNNALEHVQSAGAKVASDLTKTAAAHAILVKLAEEACADKKKSEKRSAMGAQTPQSASGFNAAQNMGGGSGGM
jgi:hypothetical protein